jgi:pimeloyl-ACP methyl ester carboxylesterase
MCTLELWHRQITALAPEARIVAYDLRGHGQSGLSEALDYSIEAFGDDLEAVLDAHLRKGERAVLCGNSMGAMTIAAWAHRHPDSVPKRAAAVAMLGTGMGDLITQALVVRGPTRIETVRERVTESLMCTEIPFDTAPDSVIRTATHYLALGPDARPEDIALVARMARDCPRVVRGRCGGTLSQMDVFDGLANLDVPAVVIAGGADKMTPPVHSHRLAELLPSKPEVVEVPGAGHMVPLEADQVVNSALRELLAEASGSKRGRRAAPTAA